MTPDTGDGTATAGDSVQVVLAVSGPAGPPSACAFNGRACQSGQAGQLPEPGNSPQPGHASQPRHSSQQQDQQRATVPLSRRTG